jgi:xanthine/CO dehydrogenase XdhC/CoxF family maturation factor
MKEIRDIIKAFYEALQRSVSHSPVGLDTGAETSEEIALSLLAEIKALFTRRKVQTLRSHDEVIPLRSAATIEEEKIISKT